MASRSSLQGVPGERPRRLRTLTPKAKAEYEARVSRYIINIENLWENVEFLTEQIAGSGDITNIDLEIKKYFDLYAQEADSYLSFLVRTKSEQSEKERQNFSFQFEENVRKYKSVVRNIERLKTQDKDNLSVSSQKTQTFSSSKLSETIVKTRAKAEAQRERLKYTRREVEMTKKKAELEAEMMLIQQEREVAAAEVELSFLEAEREGDVASSRPLSSERGELPNDEEDAKLQRTADYVNEQTSINTELNVEALPFVPEAAPIVPNIARFLLKKDLLLGSLTKFSDNAESFPSWKASFKNVISELCLTAAEEIDLMVKWLGPESAKQISSIKVSCASAPSEGLHRAWTRLEERYGAPQMIEAAVQSKLKNFSKLTPKDSKKLYELYDILSEIQSIKSNLQYKALLSYYDTSSGVLPIVHKLPHGLQEKWTTRAARYRDNNKVAFPPFSYFVEFVGEMARVKNDPSFAHSVEANMAHPHAAGPPRKHSVIAKKTVVMDKPKSKPASVCVLHKTNHSLNECRTFQTKPFYDRKKILKDNNICFKCCESDDHRYKNCNMFQKCQKCGSDKHATAMHLEPGPQAAKQHGGENKAEVYSKCTQICGSKNFPGKSCAKLVQVTVCSSKNPECSINAYAILDEQSNRTLAKSEVFDMLDPSCREIEYCLNSCSGRVTTAGRSTEHLVIKSRDGHKQLELNNVLECNDIPNKRDEIPTPSVARHHTHLKELEEHIPEIDDKREILLLIGRDVADAHHVQEQIIGPRGTPYAQKLAMGWVIVGETCLGNAHKPEVVNAMKTYVSDNKRPTLFPPCTNRLNVFEKTEDDNKLGLSTDEKHFNMIMEEGFEKIDGKWSAPLPFQNDRQRLPNNRAQALTRAKVLESTFKRSPKKQSQYVDFMGGILENGHAEVAPPVEKGEECWYLPHFGVFHPKKPDKIRVVFDSSAKYKDVSLNDVLLSGPNLMNSLLGVLLRFRKEKVAIVADIEQMFYCFNVSKEHRNYLRFFWYENNDPQKNMIEYRMRVHVFGNKPSPSVATYGLRKTAEICEDTYGPDVNHFVSRNFYVDDGLASLPTSEEAVDLMQRTQAGLQKEGNLRLHKIMSNEKKVMDSFPATDLASNLKDLDLSSEDLPVQRSLGLLWNLTEDEFRFQMSSEDKPYTRRGVLSVVNSIYDPLGFVAPVTIQGKLLLRELMSETKGWDDPLPVEKLEEWNQWKASLKHLETIQIPRAYLRAATANIEKKALHIYSDASEKAIAACAYMVAHSANQCQIGFVLGKAKVAPKCGHTIPRLELCAAVLAVELWDTIAENIEIEFDEVLFHTDSKVVLGYICNQKRRFYMYVGNRVERICQSTKPDQWSYVRSELNPADCATRPASDIHHKLTSWLEGPSHLNQTSRVPVESTFPLVDADTDKEIKPVVHVMKTVCVSSGIGTKRFERFSSWKRLVSAISLLKRVCRSKVADPDGMPKPEQTVKERDEAERFIVRALQLEAFKDEVSNLEGGRRLSPSSSLSPLSPLLDENGLLRVGGRLENSELNQAEKHPLILPKDHHVCRLLVRHYHEEVTHQGRHFTEGAVRAAGLWIVGCKRLVNSVIHQCVKCRKLRGRMEKQKMSDLPPDRLRPCPPFTYVGVDVFGPWHVVTRRTRGGAANSKRWAVLFSCLTCRAIHIEVIEDMSSSAFINALRRFESIRGNVQEYRSDRGTNFIGSTDSLNIPAINVEDGQVKQYLNNKKCVWIFNPPHSSHMGGAWERMIGVARRILEAMMAEPEAKRLTHEVLTTLMAEVCAIVNARPLVSVSTDPEEPEVLSPAALLTQKTNIVVEPLKNTQPSIKSQWRLVQTMADNFWGRWKASYLQTLQQRRKWCDEKKNIQEGDVVLLKDSSTCRNDWPVGVIEQALRSNDGLVRKSVVRVVRDGKSVKYTRPISELVVLCSDEN